MKQLRYVVVCKDDHGYYVPATSRVFYGYAAAELYTASIAVDRAPIIVRLDG